ncbi:MAG: Crp/Fnr family transcriptional regulator [Clostridiales bacterium]|nr:Crp/Fnr family transcriptional regulator [Clostridiales bacterium]
MTNMCQCGHCTHDLCMHRVPIFSTLNQEEIEKIANLIHHREYKKGEILVSEGEKSESIVIMHEGSAKAYKYTADGREQILYIFSEGDFFGEQNLLSDNTATYFVEALQDVKTCVLLKSQFQQLLHQYPEIAIKIIDELGQRMMRLENALQSMGVRNVDARLGSLLIEFESKYGSTVPEGILIQLPLSREGIANYLGIARETVSRKLSQLEQEGIIRSLNNKTILITDQSSLKEIAGTV